MFVECIVGDWLEQVNDAVQIPTAFSHSLGHVGRLLAARHMRTAGMGSLC